MPSQVGTDRIDKAMLGSITIDAMYLGTDKVYPNITTWEKWQPAWPEATGSSLSFSDRSGWPLNFDGTEGAEVEIRSLNVGQALRYTTVPGYFLKTTTSGMRRYEDGQPTPIKSTYIEDVEHTDENAYPTDGVHSDQFWYVRK